MYTRDQSGPFPVQLSGGLSSQTPWLMQRTLTLHTPLTAREPNIAQQFSDTSVPHVTFSIAYAVANFQVVILTAPVGTILSAGIGMRLPWHSSATPNAGDRVTLSSA